MNRKKNDNQRFTVSVPVKPYVKRFIELNYGNPADFTSNIAINRFFISLLHKPTTAPETICPDDEYLYFASVDITISEDYFYRYGWEMSKKNIIAFGRHFEERAKHLMRNYIGIYHAIGLPLNTGINKFRDRFGFDEDSWTYEAVKKDFYRHGILQDLDFDDEIFRKIEYIVLVNLYDLGTVTKKTLNDYENN